MSVKLYIAYIVMLSSCVGCVFSPPVSKGSALVGSAGKVSKESVGGMDLDMMYVKGGCYKMGDLFDDPEAGPEEKPVHEVCVDDFYIGTYEVTQAQWKSIVGTIPPLMEMCGDNCPAGGVSWNDAQEFIRRLNSKSGGGVYRLPTEAEWEYACRSGGKDQRFCGGEDLEALSWYDGNGNGVTQPVGAPKESNGLGIYNMSGNVWEWVNDYSSEDYYSISPRNNPKGPDSGEARTLRGGCTSGPPRNQRASRRKFYPPDFQNNHVGFRLARSVGQIPNSVVD